MARKFQDADHYKLSHPASYHLMPFRFLSLDKDREIISNDWGEWIVADRGTAVRIARREVDPRSDLYRSLKARQIIYDEYSGANLDLAATKLRTKKVFLDRGASLHIFVVTLRCEHTCAYCQVSRQTTDRAKYDMSLDTASKAIDLMFRSPSKNLTLEFQGGEPLLAFDRIRFIIEECERRSQDVGKTIQPVITTNLALASTEILEYCRDHTIQISTSLDGPAWIHNQNRSRPGNNSYELAVEGIQRAREIVGHDSVAALMTTTRLSLEHPIAIIDEYVRLGFASIFLRPISPYGFALKTKRRTGYAMEEFANFYRTGLHHIISLNRQGGFLSETYARIVLSKILTPFATGYVDLDSPSGAALRTCVYNYDGDVYASDESRMLREMNDFHFRLGNVHTDSYSTLFAGEDALTIVADGTAEALPGCADCALQPFCGGDPVFHHATQGNTIGHRPTSDFCSRNMFVIKHLLDLLTGGDEELHQIFWSWVRGIRQTGQD